MSCWAKCCILIRNLLHCVPSIECLNSQVAKDGIAHLVRILIFLTFPLIRLYVVIFMDYGFMDY